MAWPLALTLVSTQAALAQEACPGKPNAHVTGRLETKLGDGTVKRTTRCACDEGYESNAGACVRSTTEQAPAYQPSGNAFIGGTSWIVGYNDQNLSPEMIARAKEMLKKQMDLAGIPYGESIDFNRYNFILGIGASTHIFRDLATRVVFDQLKNGKFSKDEQALYASLKGRSFDELACHSNGAMICLAALQNKDIVAKHVVLYGPQITPESLKMWDELVKTGKLGAIEIRINQGDPVPPVSFLLSSPAAAIRTAFTPFQSAAMFTTPVMSLAIREYAPSINVKTFSCGAVPTLDCHSMTVYKERR
jgi:hypothetical protein